MKLFLIFLLLNVVKCDEKMQDNACKKCLDQAKMCLSEADECYGKLMELELLSTQGLCKFNSDYSIFAYKV